MTYDPFKRTTPEPKGREEIFAWAFVKDVRTFTGSLRAVDDERWEVVYRIGGGLYRAQVFPTKARRAVFSANLALAPPRSELIRRQINPKSPIPGRSTTDRLGVEAAP
jgi:hypothetical protein